MQILYFLVVTTKSAMYYGHSTELLEEVLMSLVVTSSVMSQGEKFWGASTKGWAESAHPVPKSL